MPDKQSKATIPEKRQVGRPVKYKTPEEMQILIDAYFKERDETKEPYTMTGLAIALDMDRKSLVNYAQRDEFFLTIKKAREKVEDYAERSLYRASNVTGIIFNLKNNFSWVDRQEIDQHNTFDFGSATLTDED